MKQLRPLSCVLLQFLVFLVSLIGVNKLSAQTLQERLIAETPSSLAAVARSEGDPHRGAGVFFARVMACSTCHSVGERPEGIGPDLSKMDPKKMTDVALVEAILEPSKTIAAAYATVTVETVDGRSVTGLPVEENGQQLVLRDASRPEKFFTLKKEDIANRQKATQSIMPNGQVNQLQSRQQFVDLLRYLIELRDGGPKRARELQPPPNPDAQQVPDIPLPWQPVLQRGEVAVESNLKYPHAVAIGFDGGTVLFDANSLRTVARWSDGFVRSSPQNYFGLYWHRDGGPANLMTAGPHPLVFRLNQQDEWTGFEPAGSSDPNLGTRFDGYQIGQSSVRLHYRVLVGERRLRVTETVRSEKRSSWQGFAREFRFAGLPAEGMASLRLPDGSDYQCFSAAGEKVDTSFATKAGAQRAPLIGYKANGKYQVVRLQTANDASWLASDLTAKANGETVWRVVVAGGNANGETDKLPMLRVDMWTYNGRHTEPTAAEMSSLAAIPPAMQDSFAPVESAVQKPTNALALLPLQQEDEPKLSVVQRPAVKPQKNVDEFESARGRFLRFVVTKTTGNAEPGLDELEVYGIDPKVNLALAGKATASSVISGYPIHQIPHLNDGKLGNNNSWISGEPGGGWAQIEFPEAVDIRKIVWARDQTGICKDRLAVAYRIEVSADGMQWTKVGDQQGRGNNTVPAIRRDASPSYEMESIPLPYSTARLSDIAFSDGVMYAISMTDGQIWRSRIPPVGEPKRVAWQRYACGLYHPTGIAIVDGRLFVAQKQEITELIDHNGDGTVEHFRTVATGWGLSTGWHEYCFGLAVDPQKNLWFALNTGYFWTHNGFVNPGRWRGSILRVSHESEKLEVMATGCRVPNGLAQGPDGNIFYTDNQGDWIQSCKLACVVPGRFYGHPETKEDALPQGTYPDGRSAIWMPYHRSRSSSGPVHDTTSGKFGPFSGQMFLGDVGYGANPGIMRLALEKVNGEYQGACIRFVDGQPLGCQRMKFGPDSQLYVASLTSGLARIAFDGETPMAIRAVNIRPQGKGFVVSLTKPLAVDTKLAASHFKVKRYHYIYSGKYGSPRADEQTVPLQNVEVSADRKSITLSLPVESHPIGMVYEINLGKLSDAEGDVLVQNEAWYTVHQIPK